MKVQKATKIIIISVSNSKAMKFLELCEKKQLFRDENVDFYRYIVACVWGNKGWQPLCEEIYT